MSNTRTLAVVAVLMAATLVVGTFATVATTQSAFAYAKKPRQDDNKKTRDNGSGSRNGNTITVEKCKNKGSASGFDTTVNQECENLICTHPGNNATCVTENEAAAVTPPVVTPPTPPPIEECTNVDSAFDNDITMVDTVHNSVTLQAGDVICIQGLGNHAAFDLTTGTLITSVLVSEGQCNGQNPEHEGQATLTSPPDAHLGNTRLGGNLCVGFTPPT